MTKHTYFASGSNHPGEIRGLSDIGHPVGVAADVVLERGQTAEAIAELKACTAPVFLDSGAFSEVQFGPAGPRVVSPISDKQWLERLELGAELAAALGPQLYFVAPDQVGYPAETLERLATYQRQVRAIDGLGARILLCLQGEDKVAFWAQALDAAGLDDAVASLPMKKNATSPAEVVDFARRARPTAIHLLGLGMKSRDVDVPALLAELEAVDPDLEVSLDSNMIRRHVGRDKPGGRLMTRVQDAVTDEMDEALWSEVLPAGAMGTPLDYTDCIGDPASWMTRSVRARLAKTLGLEGAERRSMIRDPSAWLQEDENYLCPVISWELDIEWAILVRGHDGSPQRTGETSKRKGVGIYTTERKRRAIVGAFGPSVAR